MGSGLMLAVCAAAGTRTDEGAPAAAPDAGAFAAGIARLWAGAGRQVLLVDADAHGTGLAARIGAATRTVLSPERRGLPSLIAERSDVDVEAVTRHCWQMPVAGAGSLWLLLAPNHPRGACRSSAWLAERADTLAALSRQRAVVVALPGAPAASYAALACAARRLAVVGAGCGGAPEQARSVLAEFGPEADRDAAGLLVVDPEAAATPDDDAEPERTDAGVDGAVWRIKPVREAALLGGRSRRGDRAALQALAAVADRLADGTVAAPEQSACAVALDGRRSARVGASAAAAVRSERPQAAAAGATP